MRLLIYLFRDIFFFRGHFFTEGNLRSLMQFYSWMAQLEVISSSSSCTRFNDVGFLNKAAVPLAFTHLYNEKASCSMYGFIALWINTDFANGSCKKIKLPTGKHKGGKMPPATNLCSRWQQLLYLPTDNTWADTMIQKSPAEFYKTDESCRSREWKLAEHTLDLPEFQA